MGNSRGARKLARTPHVNQKKKKKQLRIKSIANIMKKRNEREQPIKQAIHGGWSHCTF